MLLVGVTLCLWVDTAGGLMTNLIERSSKMATRKDQGLPEKLKICQARAAAAEATRKAEAQRPAPETAQKTKGERL